MKILFCARLLNVNNCFQTLKIFHFSNVQFFFAMKIFKYAVIVAQCSAF